MLNKQWFLQKLKENRLSQSQIGEAIGKDRTTVGRILNGNIEFKYSHAKALAPLLKTSINEILEKAGILNDSFSLYETDFADIESAIEAFKHGEILIVTDDDDRENEGDLIVAASKCTPEQMAFIIRNTSGIVCAPLSGKRATQLRLDPMVSHNDAPHTTAFTITVDAKHGTTTGISAKERAVTVHALANDNAIADDFVRPGHVFPLIAREGGVLVRTGHTEATVDMCRLAGLPEVGVISEMVNDDGTVMKGNDIKEFGKKHGLKVISIAQLVAYRQSREKLIERTAEFDIETEIGTLRAYSYTTKFDNVHHLALIYGKIGNGKDVPTRLHRGDITQDVFGGAKSIKEALQKFKEAGRGVLIYLRDGAAGVPANTPNGNMTDSESSRLAVWHEIGVGAQILKDLGISTIHLLSRSNKKFVGLSGFGIEISSNEAI